MHEIFEAIKEAAFKIDRAIKTEPLGYSNSENASGEEQLQLDIKSDLIIEDILSRCDSVGVLISEEKQDKKRVNDNGRYTICYDPLDGSSLVDVDLSVGSIFGIYDGEPKGESLTASAYVVYGPRLEMVYAIKNQGVTHLRSTGDDFSEVGQIVLKQKGKLNAPGGTQQHWCDYHKTLIDDLFAQGYRLRYSGGMVPDLHQILLKGGGLFSYPATSDNPHGKLRQLFEVIPFALVFEEAGGVAINNRGKDLLSIAPSHIHDTTPCFFGSAYEISQMRKAYGVEEV